MALYLKPPAHPAATEAVPFSFSFFFFPVVGMLKSLHQLQEENRRLEEQIKTLTMKKERLQLLSAQLSVPFTPSTTSAGKHTNFNYIIHHLFIT